MGVLGSAQQRDRVQEQGWRDEQRLNEDERRQEVLSPQGRLRLAWEEAHTWWPAQLPAHRLVTLHLGSGQGAWWKVWQFGLLTKAKLRVFTWCFYGCFKSLIAFTWIFCELVFHV